ncbi:hypothetical protein PVK06_023873 [Gossypium arboreum]|uniref:O-acyltransferase WSD1 C-terminal domain-containing protein n=1 Tax=Gossypium arboreum TaxID=29729 RepID=A0ABR0PCI7_GOSAR|nr:hypothetical protein PVK06_023873 [Gossypium arboreum]
MESGNELKWRKQDLKPIDTSRRSSSSKREEKVEEEENKNSQKTGEEEPLSPSSRLFHESNFNIYVIAIMGCKTRIYPDVFKANLSHTSLRHPRFSSLQVPQTRLHIQLSSFIGTVSLDDIKLVKNAMNTTINDVALGITQAGLSRYINKIYGGNNKDEGAIEMDNLPKKIHLRSTLLINIRPSAGIQPLADMMEKDAKAKWGNWIGYVLLLFTIAIRDDPLDYVRDAKATIDRKKRSLEAIFTFC